MTLERSTRPLRLLVIEDDPDAADLVRMLVERSEHTEYVIERAIDLITALHALLHGDPVDGIVLDLGLPDAPSDPDRLGALRTLALVEDLPPVIVVTASMRDVTEKAMELGAAAFLPKIHMIAGDRLLDTIDRVIVNR